MENKQLQHLVKSWFATISTEISSLGLVLKKGLAWYSVPGTHHVVCVINILTVYSLLLRRHSVIGAPAWHYTINILDLG